MNLLNKENAAICPRCGRQGCAVYLNGAKYCSVACARGLMQPERDPDYKQRVLVVTVTDRPSAEPVEEYDRNA